MPDELVPILVAPRLSLERVAAVTRAAMAHGEVLLPLESEPAEEGLHALELHAAELEGPLVLLATPLGRAIEGLFPLRVRPLHSAQAGELDRFLGSITEAPAPAAPPNRMTESDLDGWLQDYLAGSSGECSSQDAAEPSPPSSSQRGEQLRSFLSSSALPALSLVSISTLPTIPAPAPFATLDDFGDIAERAAPAAPPACPDPMIGRTLGGKYRVEQLLGRGGMGCVYRAQHVGLGRAVAVKVLHPENAADAVSVRRFRREALAHSRIDHPNVLHVHDFGQEDNEPPYLVMDLLPGRDLRALLDEQGKMPMERVVAIMSQVCAALSEAHAQSVVHRDIKPANIMIHAAEDEDGTPYEHVTVCDFGLAKAYGKTPKAAWGDSSPVTALGTAVGTPEYLSPEQALGEDCDPRTDIYTCGVVMYEMATGRVPFSIDSLMGLLVAVATKAPRAPSELNPQISRAFEAVILKALSKNRSLRQQSAQRLRAELMTLVPNAARRTRRWPAR